MVTISFTKQELEGMHKALVYDRFSSKHKTLALNKIRKALGKNDFYKV